MKPALDLDIYPIWYNPFWKSYPFIFSLLFALLGLAFALYFFILKNKQDTKILSKNVSAMQLLMDLVIPKNSTKEEKKLFYDQLILVLKKLFVQYELEDLSGSTEQELLGHLNKNHKAFHKDLEIVIKNAVFVKYSNDDFYTRMQLDKDLVINVARELERKSKAKS